MLRRLGFTTGLALILTGGALAQDAEDVTLYRVFVGDHADAKVTAFDLDKPDNRWSFETSGQNKLYGVNDGVAVVAVQSDSDAVHFFKSGIKLDSHGDHSDIKIANPAALDETLSGPRPFHLIDHHGKLAINFDRGGYAEIVDANELSHGELESRRIPQARAHHGFVAPLGKGWVTTVASDAPVEGDALEEIGTVAVEGMPYNIAVVGGSGKAHDKAHDKGGDDHAHAHGHSHGDEQIYKGYFEDSQIADRPLSDYAGDWQSVYPYLQDGTLDPVMAHKAEAGDKSAEEYKAYYEIGYRTDVERIAIEGDTVTFYRDGKPTSARYADDGYEVLTYKKGNRGVRFIFRKSEGDEAAPQYIQFSDHRIAPAKTDHYHLYWGDDRAALLEEVTNWPTYYPSELSAEEIVREMMAH